MVTIGLIGHLAEGEKKYDGQTVSTRAWKTELSDKRHDFSLITVDTYNYSNRKVEIIKEIVHCMAKCSHIVFMLSGNGMRVMLPMLYYLNKIFNKKIYHRVIGGNLNNYVKENSNWVKYLNAFEVNWVQSPQMVKDLRTQGIMNAEFLENFRNSKPIRKEEIHYPNGKKEFCTFSRVSKDKGITLAINSIAEIAKRRDISLDIFGPIDSSYNEEFQELLHLNSNVVFYKGSVDSSKSVSTLSNYYFHLFPTTWGGEGFPGTLIDCYNAALPTIASSWAYNTEYICDGIDGFIYDWEKPELLKELIEKSLELNNDQYCSMRNSNLLKAEKYTADVIMKKILCRMELDV